MVKKVVIGMSGGVDSSVAAYLLKKEGYEVVGVTMKTWQDREADGSELAMVKDARAVAERLGIEYHVVDFKEAFKKHVMDYFVDEYLQGRTPNPCVVCNRFVKWEALLHYANEVGADFIATGHYARISSKSIDGGLEKYYVKQGVNIRKDQSYMLYRLGQDVLSRLIFPLGDFEDKEQIRDIARSVNLSNAEKKDSQEICFVPNDDYVSYMAQRGHKSKPGDYVNSEGHVLGQHQGIIHYTIGQRKGLGIALGKPAFVTRIDAETNQVVLGSNEDLFSCQVLSSGNVISDGSTAAELDGMKVLAKVRYSAKPAEAVLSVQPDGRILTVFTEPQRAVTPGQSIVWYDEDCVIGGGFID
jgi:tRNA-specific 2-thiouridylase